MSAPSPVTTSRPPKLIHLALSALCRDWSSATALDGLSTDLAKLVWAHVKDHHARQGITPVPCAAMYPLVRASWQVLNLDLSDAGKWITDTALQAGLCPTRPQPPVHRWPNHARPRLTNPHPSPTPAPPQPLRTNPIPTPAPPHQRLASPSLRNLPTRGGAGARVLALAALRAAHRVQVRQQRRPSAARRAAKPRDARRVVVAGT